MTVIATPTPWFTCLKANASAHMRLFCLPYGGAGAMVFRTWPEGLSPEVEVWAAQLPGRERRVKEQSATRIGPLVQALAHDLLPRLNKPFAFFGHSMGALLGFELTRQLRRERNPLPLHMFVSGFRAPHLPDWHRPIHGLPEPEFLDELRCLGGTPYEVLKHPELMQLLIPILRADFELVHTYQYTLEPPVNCSITAFGGTNDDYVTRDDLEGWRDQAAGSFLLYMLPGDHFFLHAEQGPLLEIIAQRLWDTSKDSSRT
jgi:medium-chain acyl-[acyl-carrier-protein] hydrolase